MIALGLKRTQRQHNTHRPDHSQYIFYGWITAWMDARMDGWIGGWMDGCIGELTQSMDGWMDGWTPVGAWVDNVAEMTE